MEILKRKKLLKIVIKERATKKVVVELLPTKQNIEKASQYQLYPELVVIKVYEE